MWTEFLNFKIFKNFLSTSSNLIGVQLSICLPFIICTIYIGKLADPIALGAFGLTATCINMFFNSLILGIQENLGSKCSKFFTGQKKYKSINRLFWKSIFCALMLVLFFLVFSYFSYEILIAIDIQEVVAGPTAQLLMFSVPYIFVQAINQILQNLVSSQHLSDRLIYMNVISIALVFYLAKKFILD